MKYPTHFRKVLIRTASRTDHLLNHLLQSRQIEANNVEKCMICDQMHGDIDDDDEDTDEDAALQLLTFETSD